MKQTKLILLLPAIELLVVIVPEENIHQLVGYVQLELFVICLCMYFGMKRSMALLLSIWAIWMLATNNWNVMQEYSNLEAGAFAALVYWIFRRPEWIPSDPLSDDTVQIAFYYGDNSPFLAKVFALLGLNVTGIAVIIGDVAMVPVGKKGKVERRERKLLKKWIKLDVGALTREPPDGCGWRGVMFNFCRLEGVQIEKANCMTAMKPIISRLPYWSPLDSPSSLMSKILSGRK